MSLLVSDMCVLLDQSIVLGLAAVSRHPWDFIGLSLYAKNTRNYPFLAAGNGTVLANVKRGWNCAVNLVDPGYLRRRIGVVAARPGKGRLTERSPAVRP